MGEYARRKRKEKRAREDALCSARAHGRGGSVT
jgi:hypothetical protein